MTIWYCTREDVISALGDTALDTRGFADVDRACGSAALSIEGLLHRRFYPFTGVRTVQRLSSDRLWLEENEVVSLTSITMDGTAVPVADWTLSPTDGPPYTAILFPNGPSLSYNGDLILSGVFGYGDDRTPAGTAAEAMDATETDLDVSDGSLIGVGSVLYLDTERLIVTGRSWLTSAQTLQVALTAKKSDVSVSVTTGSAFKTGERILLDSERMLITDIAGNTLTVKRAVDGTVLATHSGSTVYLSRTLTVTRGALGSTAATHLTSTAITVWTPPELVRSLAVAKACNQLLQESGGYSRTLGSGDNARDTSGAGLDSLAADTRRAYGRVARLRSV